MQLTDQMSNAVVDALLVTQTDIAPRYGHSMTAPSTFGGAKLVIHGGMVLQPQANRCPTGICTGPKWLVDNEVVYVDLTSVLAFTDGPSASLTKAALATAAATTKWVLERPTLSPFAAFGNLVFHERTKVSRTRQRHTIRIKL